LCYMSGQTHYESNTDTLTIQSRCDYNALISDGQSTMKKLLDKLSFENEENPINHDASTVVLSFEHLESGDKAIYVGLGGIVFKNGNIYKSNIADSLLAEIKNRISEFAIFWVTGESLSNAKEKGGAKKIDFKQLGSINLEKEDLEPILSGFGKYSRTNIHFKNEFEDYSIYEHSGDIYLKVSDNKFKATDKLKECICSKVGQLIKACK
jgi:hypothetical protein